MPAEVRVGLGPAHTRVLPDHLVLPGQRPVVWSLRLFGQTGSPWLAGLWLSWDCDGGFQGEGGEGLRVWRHVGDSMGWHVGDGRLAEVVAALAAELGLGGRLLATWAGCFEGRLEGGLGVEGGLLAVCLGNPRHGGVVREQAGTAAPAHNGLGDRTDSWKSYC